MFGCDEQQIERFKQDQTARRLISAAAHDERSGVAFALRKQIYGVIDGVESNEDEAVGRGCKSWARFKKRGG